MVKLVQVKHIFRHYLKLYLDPNQGQDQNRDQDQNQNQNQDQNKNQDQNQNLNQQQAKNIVIVRKDDRDWIDPETNEFYIGFNNCDINMITTNNMYRFKDCVIVVDDMDDRLNKGITNYFTKERHYSIQMIVMCHKPA